MRNLPICSKFGNLGTAKKNCTTNGIGSNIQCYLSSHGVSELIKKDLRRVNAFLPEASRARRFVLLHKEFDADEAELTRTRKLRREFMEVRYQDLIASMYSASGEVKVEAPVTYRDGRRGTVTTTIKVREVS